MFERYFTFLHETPEAGGGGEQATAEQPAEGGEQQRGGIDLNPIFERLDSMGERFGPIEDRLGVGVDEYVDPYAEPEEGAQETPPGEIQQQEYTDPAQAEQQQNLAALQQFVDNAIAEKTGPLQQQIQEADIYSRAVQLEEEFPELQDEDNARALFQQARDLGHRLGLTDQQSRDPDFLEVLYRAGQRTERAEGETPAGEQEQGEVTLEGSGGASRAPEEDDPAMAIVNAGRRNSFLTG